MRSSSSADVHSENLVILMVQLSTLIVCNKIVGDPEGANFIGKAKLLETPMGKIAKNLLEEGYNSVYLPED